MFIARIFTPLSTDCVAYERQHLNEREFGSCRIILKIVLIRNHRLLRISALSSDLPEAGKLGKRVVTEAVEYKFN